LLQVSSGFSYRMRPGEPSAPTTASLRRLSVEPGSIRIGRERLVPTKRYRVTVNSFLAEGGDGFEVLREGTERKEGPLDIDALAAYLGQMSSAGKPLDPPKALTRIGGDACK